MKLGWPLEIAGTGAGLPERVVTNDEMSTIVDTTDDWIVQRTGIRERRFAAPDEATLALATRAARQALERASMTPEDIDVIIIATITPELVLPSTACLLQAELGCRWIPAFDVSAACSGFVWAFHLACQQVQNGLARNVLVIGSETITRITDMQDRATCVLFGDAAGAAIIRKSDDPERGLLAMRWGADGGRGMLINVPAGGAREPASIESVENRRHFMKMAGREVYRFAVTQMQDVIKRTCDDAGITVDDLTLVIPHQSNLRIIESACNRVGMPLERVVINIDRYGNSSAASVAVALHESVAGGRIKSGDLAMLVAFGAGLTWGSILLRV